MSDRINFESLLVEKTEKLIGGSLFDMINIGGGFIDDLLEFGVEMISSISRNFCCVEFEIKLRRSMGKGWTLSLLLFVLVWILLVWNKKRKMFGTKYFENFLTDFFQFWMFASPCRVLSFMWNWRNSPTQFLSKDPLKFLEK